MRWNFQFRVLFNRYPVSQSPSNSNIRKLLEVVKRGLKYFEQRINEIYSASNIIQARGEDLDRWGIVLGMERNPGEDDTTYRGRILEKLRSSKKALTVKAIKDGIMQSAGVNAQIVHLRAMDFPLDWGSPFVSEKEKMKILVEIPQNADIDTVEQALRDRVLCAVVSLVVYKDEQGNYVLRRRLNHGC